MARKTNIEAAEATSQEAALLAIADLIYAAFGNSGTAKAEEPTEEPQSEPEEAPAEVDADEVDADEVDIDAERDRLMKLTIGAVRKELIARDFDEDDVKTEKSKSALVDSLLDDMYGEDDEPEDDEPEDDEEEYEDDVDADEAEDADEDDSDDEEDEPFTEEELTDMSLGELKEIAVEWELEIPKGARAKTYVKSILEAQEIEEDSEADDEEDEYEDERAELEALTLAELRKVVKEEHGLTARDIKGLDKDAILDLVFEDDEEG